LIGKVGYTNSCGATCRYLIGQQIDPAVLPPTAGPAPERVTHALVLNLHWPAVEEASSNLDRLARGSDDQKFLHIKLSASPQDRSLTAAEWTGITETLLIGMSPDNELWLHPGLMVVHGDTDHQHAHVVVSRRSLAGDLWYTYMDHARLRESVEAVEIAFDLLPTGANVMRDNRQDVSLIRDRMCGLNRGLPHLPLKRLHVPEPALPTRSSLTLSTTGASRKAVAKMQRVALQQIKATSHLTSEEVLTNWLHKLAKVDVEMRPGTSRGLVLTATDTENGPVAASSVSTNLGLGALAKSVGVTPVSLLTTISYQATPPETSSSTYLQERQKKHVAHAHDQVTYLARFTHCDASAVRSSVSDTPLKIIRNGPNKLLPWMPGVRLPDDVDIRIVDAARAVRRARHSMDLLAVNRTAAHGTATGHDVLARAKTAIRAQGRDIWPSSTAEQERLAEDALGHHQGGYLVYAPPTRDALWQAWKNGKSGWPPPYRDDAVGSRPIATRHHLKAILGIMHHKSESLAARAGLFHSTTADVAFRVIAAARAQSFISLHDEDVATSAQRAAVKLSDVLGEAYARSEYAYDTLMSAPYLPQLSLALAKDRVTDLRGSVQALLLTPEMRRAKPFNAPVTDRALSAMETVATIASEGSPHPRDFVRALGLASDSTFRQRTELSLQFSKDHDHVIESTVKAMGASQDANIEIVNDLAKVLKISLGSEPDQGMGYGI